MQQRHVAWQVRRNILDLSASRHGWTLPFTDSAVELIHPGRGHWKACSLQNGQALIRGVSKLGVIRVTIEAVWN